MGELLRRELRRGEAREEKRRRKDFSREEGRRRAAEDGGTLASAIPNSQMGWFWTSATCSGPDSASGSGA
jgi:hypothetical protein